MKRFIKKGMPLVLAALLLTGCGDELAVLTESEEFIVVNYSAGTLAKHNSYQQEGLTMVYPREEEDVFSEDEEEQKPEETKEPEAETEGESGGEAQDGQTEEEETSTAVSFTEALAVPGEGFSFKDYSVSSSYQQGEYFSLDAAEGNTFVILNVNMTNTGTEAAACDLLSQQPIFTLSINEEAGVKNEITMLENDLSTYTGTLEAGQTVAGILLFEVPAASAESISAFGLSVQMNDTTNEINMK